jgi:hypothetical protein
MRMHGRGRLALTVLLAGALTACGSTVQTAGGQLLPADQQGLEPGLSAPAGDGLSAAAPGEVAGTGGGPLDEQRADGPAPHTAGDGGPSAADPGPAPGGAAAPGTPGRPAPKGGDVEIGFVTPDFTKLLKAFGGSGEGASAFGGYKRMIESINKRGGIGGRQVKGVYYATDGAANDYAGEAQKACEYMTQDHDVDVVITTSYFREDFNACLTKAGIAQIDTDQFANGPALQRSLPGLFTPNGLNVEANYRTLIDKMHDTQWLTSKSSVGVIIEGCPQNTATYESVVKPRVERLGARIDAVTFDCISGAGDISKGQAAVSSAVLRFKSAGVDRVIAMSAAEATILTGFQQRANNQDYRPGYMITTYAFPTGWSKVYANGQAASTTGDQRLLMHGIGWSSLLDLDERTLPANQRQAAAQAACRSLDPTENDTAGKNDPIGTAFFMWGCDSLQLLSAMLVDSAFATDIASLRRSYLRVAPKVASAGNPLGAFGPGQANSDGVTGVYTYAFSTRCTCFVSDGSISAPSR